VVLTRQSVFAPFVSSVQFVCVLHKFYWNLCWLIARSALFYVKSVRKCKERPKCNSCNVYVSALTAVLKSDLSDFEL
jgi:hypothetical protein